MSFDYVNKYLFFKTMSKLDRLSIRGIRSYGPEEAQVIDFCTPLTLIVGQNGSGKTSVIESLMYASTGSLPGLSKGGAFIYDPKIAGETSVKAQIRLRFNDALGKTITMNRNLQASQTKKGISMKTLEALLQVETDKGKKNITQKCADVNAEVQNRLGVSKAILENVIFCHQEDSNWPLSEPSILKKKFDDIFSATEYAKMVKLLNDISKKMLMELKLSKTELKYQADTKHKASKKKIEVRELTDKIQAFKKDIADFEEQLNNKNSQMDSLVESTKEFNSIEALISEYKSKRDHIHQNVVELSKEITTMPTESNEELRVVLDVRREELAANKLSIQQLQTALRQKEDEEKTLIKSKDQVIAIISKAQLQKEQYLKKENEFENLKLKNGDSFALQKQASDYKSKLKMQHDTYTREKQSLTLLIKAIDNSNRDLLISFKNSKLGVGNEIKQLDSILNQSLVSDPTSLMAKEESELEMNKNRLSVLESKLTESIPLINRDEMKELRKKANEKREVANKLTQMKKDVSSLQKSINDYYIEQQPLLVPYISFINDLDHIKTQLDNKSSLIKSQISNQNSQIEETNSQIYKIQADTEVLSSQLEEYKSNESKLTLLLQKQKSSISNFPTIKAQTKIALENAKSAGTMQLLFDKYIHEATHQQQCGLCQRSFQEQTQLTQFITQLQTQLTRIKQGQSTLVATQVKLQQLEEIQPLFDKVSQSTSPVNELQSLKSELNMKQGHLNTLKRDLKQFEQQYAAVSTGLSVNEKYLQIQQQLQSKTSECQQLDIELINMDVNIEDVEKKLSIYDEQQSKWNLEQTKLFKQKDDLNKVINQHKINLGEYKHQLNSYKQQQSLFKKSKVELAQCKSKLQRLEEQIEKQDAIVQQDQLKYNELTQKQAELDSNYLKDSKVIEESIVQVNAIIKELQQLEKDCTTLKVNPTWIPQQEHQLKELENQIKTVNLACQQLRQEESQQDALELGAKQLERQIQDVFKIREWQTQIKEINQLVRSKEQQLTNYDVQSFSKQQQVLNASIQQLTKQIASLNGQCKQLDDQRKTYSKELVTDYKDAHLIHHKTLIQTMTGELATADLQHYAQALDQAILAYHGHKMQLVNDIIRELWIETYQGNDIDTIAIKTEQDSNKSKSYQYRVCMIKGNVSIDMRGRCSAGQKVLASIIIRLALAQVFGINCGILALDEPTTNLDRNNIIALGHSLCKIIENRRKQSNFQLIVITHDEGFLNRIGKREFMDYYYKITKNEQQNSEIRKIECD